MNVKQELFKFSMPVHMRWSDIDELHHVNNAVYLTYFEQGRSQYLAKVCNWDWRKEGIILASASIDFMLPLLYDDNPILKIRCSRIGNKSFDFEYLVVEQGNEEKVYCKGHSVQVMFDYQQQASVAVPEQKKLLFEAYEAVGSIA